jgi:glutaminase
LYSGLVTALFASACAGSGVIPTASPGSGSKPAAAAPMGVVALPVGVQARASERQVAKGDAYQQALARAYTTHKGVTEGKNADYIPALAKVDAKLFGIALATVEGAVYEVGAARDEFSIQSISKVFTLARTIELLGAEAVEKRVGVNATGMPFNSIIAIEMNKETTPAMNPLVNPGAIATVDALPASDSNAKWTLIAGTYNAFAGRTLNLNQEVYKSESETNTRNRAITNLLQAYEVVKGDASQVLDLYTRQCSVNVNARDLAIMGATLANGGKNPVTRQQVVQPTTVEHVLAVMATAGLYETTGKWMYEVRVPAKSGVGGGIIAVVPGKFAIGTFAPPLDEAGNSVRGQRAIKDIVDDLGGSVFASSPAGARTP